MLSNESTKRRIFYAPFWIIIFIIGLAGWLACVFYGDSSRAFRAMLINFIFFTPLAGGMIVWPAIAIASQGKWARPFEQTAFTALPFAYVSLVVLIILWFGEDYWASWNSMHNLQQDFWLNSKFLFIRDFAALAIIWILAAAFASYARKGVPSILAGWLCFAYGAVFTLIAFDMVMSLDPHWYSALFGGYFFVSGMYAALAAWTVLSILSGLTDGERRHDFAKLILAVSLLTAYLMYSQLLPIWYENLSAEVRFVIPRLTITKWRYISAILTAIIYLGPLILFLTRWSKRSPAYLMSVSLLILVCLWIERWWEVTPTLGGRLRIGLTEASITAAFLASFMIGVIISGNAHKDSKNLGYL